MNIRFFAQSEYFNGIHIKDDIILEKEYPNDLNAAKESAETTMKQLEEQYGDKLESAIQYYTSYNTKEEYQDGLYLNYLQEKAVTSYAKAQIKESEIKKYYKDSIKPDIKISHILLVLIMILMLQMMIRIKLRKTLRIKLMKF